MDEKIRDQILFVLEDDNELMTTALAPDSDLDEENKQMNRELIQEHNRIIAKMECHGAVKMYQGRAVENRPC